MKQKTKEIFYKVIKNSPIEANSGDMEDRNDDSGRYETSADDYWEAQLKEEK